MLDAEFVMSMRFLQEIKISTVSIFTFPLLNLLLHHRQITTKTEALAIAKPDVVVWFAFLEVYAFSFQSRAQLFEGLVEQSR